FRSIFFYTFAYVFLTVISSGCTGENKVKSADENLSIKNTVDDTHSFGDNSTARIKHLKLNLKADFQSSILSGSATLFFDKNDADTLFLDSRDLKIDSIVSKGLVKNYIIDKPVEFLGSKISIPTAGLADSVKIYYETSPQAAAIQWLTPEQTSGKKHPFLYTQGQAILTRSWIPIQDSPGIRFTYTANIEVPKELMALMSAENPQKLNSEGKYHFTMDKAIPAYLVALAIGELRFKSFDKRSGVYAEPDLLKSAAYEFVETPAMIKSAESLYGPYEWERYDILVLPPAFPFGGMENPRLTFATPTVLAGDRSLANLIAHELAHSWSGNLVTNATWNDFWLNEGFTVYFERRIVEEVKSKDYADVNSIIGRNDLDNAFKDFGNKGDETKLLLELEGKDPDDGMNDVAYEKGYLFLVMLEKAFGRQDLDVFLKNYFQEYKFKSITTSVFEVYLYKHFPPAELDKLKVKEWLYQAGLPDNAPIFESKLFAAVDTEKPKLLDGSSKLNFKDWEFNQWLYFLRMIDGNASIDQMNSMDKRYGFSTSSNSEIQAIWLQDNINLKNTSVNSSVDQFLGRVGRRKFLMPLYEALVSSGQKDVAVKIYNKHRDSYHSVSQNSLDRLLRK
ncbi:MAG TPA: M1 family metallopeptidase, partial [Saprospiraceae bacterium]|nr:M1 family metallopeptidase [Saprospiraceae bacterium]